MPGSWGEWPGPGKLNDLTATVDELNTAADGITATAVELNRTSDVSARLVSATGDLILTSIHSGKIITFTDVTGDAVDLPAATGTGAVYRLVVVGLLSSGSHILQVAAATDDEFVGCTLGVDTDADTAVAFAAEDADGYDTITMGLTATGGYPGDWLQVIDIAAGKWALSGWRSHEGGAEAHGFTADISAP